MSGPEANTRRGFMGVAAAGDGASRTPQPVIERATQGAQCVADPAVMRRSHMDFLKHQRDDTVRGGIRGAKFSLKACVEATQASRPLASPRPRPTSASAATATPP